MSAIPTLGPRGGMELSICLTDAELTALAAVLGESLPALGPSTLDSLTAAVRDDRQAEALDSLRRRGVVVTTPGGATEVAVSVARLVEIVCRPMVVVDVYAADAGWPAHPHRLSAVALAGVATERIEDGLRLTPFSTADLLRRAAAVSGLTAEVTLGSRAAGRVRPGSARRRSAA